MMNMSQDHSNEPRILVVDDTPENQELVGEILSQEMACDLTFAMDGLQALESVRKELPDLMLLDVMMPGMSGYELCRMLQEDPETVHIPILFLTAMKETQDIVKGFDAGAVDYIAKPFNAHELIARVRTQLKIRAATRKIAEQTEELRRNENFLRTVIQSLPNPFAVIHADSYIVLMANEAYGGAAAEGRTCYFVSHQRETPCTGADHPCPLQEVKRSRQPVVVEHVHYREDGEPQYIEIHASPVLNDEGRVARIVESMFDVTERKKAEAQRSELEKTSSLGRMAGAVAHHYNNMMAVVMGNLELASAEVTDNEVLADELNEATTAARRATEMGRQMLAYLGEARAPRAPSDLCAPMRQWITEWRNELPDAVSLDARVPDSELLVCFNADQIRRTCWALIHNGVEAMEKRPGVLSVRVYEEPGSMISSLRRFPMGFVPGSAQYACVEVRDAGCGIEPDNISHVFDPFYTTKFPGRGLKLALALSAVRNHQGCMMVKSEVGKGSEFRLYLPIAPNTPNVAE